MKPLTKSIWYEILLALNININIPVVNYQALLDRLVPQGHKAFLAQREPRALRAPMELLEPMAGTVRTALMVRMVLEAL